MKTTRRSVLSMLLAGGLALAAGMNASAADKKIVLDFAQVGVESEWRTANTQSIKQAAKDIVIVSVGEVKGAFEAMMAGKLNVTVECSPLLGPQLMEAVKDVVAGKTIPKRIVAKESIFPMEVAAKEFPNRKY